MSYRVIDAFFVPGPPVGKERPRMTRSGRVYTPKRTVEYERKVRLCALAAGVRRKARPAAIALRVHIFVRNPRARPDADNIAKAICDALNGVAYDDDAQVVDLHARKLHAGDREPGVAVRIMSEVY